MARQIVLGAGGIGRSTADALAHAGHDVVLVSRSGRSSTHPAVQARSLDVSDMAALSRAAGGAATIINALNPPSYTAWDRDWPPMADAILAAAQSTGASLVTVSNLYLYGEVDAPMTGRRCGPTRWPPTRAGACGRPRSAPATTSVRRP